MLNAVHSLAGTLCCLELNIDCIEATLGDIYDQVLARIVQAASSLDDYTVIGCTIQNAPVRRMLHDLLESTFFYKID